MHALNVGTVWENLRSSIETRKVRPDRNTTHNNSVSHIVNMIEYVHLQKAMRCPKTSMYMPRNGVNPAGKSK